MNTFDVGKEVSDKYSLRGRVYSKIRDDILKGRYSTDEPIKEMQVSKELGVSRTPVREALRQLELEELVTIIPNKGAFVTGITPKDIQDIYAIRSLVEGLSAKWAAKNATDQQIKELEEVLDLFEFFYKRGNFEQLHELDNKFHKQIYDISGSRILKHVLSDFHNYAQRVRKASLESSGRAEVSLSEHKDILTAIKNHDMKNAEKLMNKHVKNTAKNVTNNKLEQITTEHQKSE
ncbi:GntR family transcriptional regulator [Vallitalea okinawensis]|uniref:GntR family transcriptional regulator n=1 Tax=Vallitalea okinawensis TaxID=2078660 RepID=UPI000CFCBAC1|nr:GntR family transcriptional regulator [Vallitalea okinawensis]